MQFLAVFTIAVFFLYLTIVLVEEDAAVVKYITFSYIALIGLNIIMMLICEFERMDYLFILEITFHIPIIAKCFYYNVKGKIGVLLGYIIIMSRYFWFK